MTQFGIVMAEFVPKHSKEQSARLLKAAGGGYDSCCSCLDVIPAMELYVCKRCRSDDYLYCSQECQEQDFKKHQEVCFCWTGRERDSYLGYTMGLSNERPSNYHQSQCAQAPPQPMNPTPAMLERSPFLHRLWFDSVLELGGEVVVKAPRIPPFIIHKIRSGLARKRLTWDYLIDSSFFFAISHAGMPLEYISICLDQMVCVSLSLCLSLWDSLSFTLPSPSNPSSLSTDRS